MTQIADSDSESDKVYKTSSGDCGFVTRFAQMVPLPSTANALVQCRILVLAGGYPSH